MKIQYINRETKKVEEEKVLGKKFLHWLYDNPVGMGLVEGIVKKKLFSRLYGLLQDTNYSKGKIADFIKEYDIDMADYQRVAHEYSSFNDFFHRELREGARPIVEDPLRLASPADGRVLAYQEIDYKELVQVKGITYSLGELLGDEALAKSYHGGGYMVIRLCPVDYHRFHFPDRGIPGETREIQGHYYSVNPIALYKKPGVYCANKRTLTKFSSEIFGNILYIEVGASCVGTIVQTYEPHAPVEKGQEKGYFRFGGSTVIMLFEPGILDFDQDLLNNTAQGIETFIKMGSGIAIAKSRK